eukprot:1352465-Pleurochrysis_carterae.AAC.1
MRACVSALIVHARLFVGFLVHCCHPFAGLQHSHKEASRLLPTSDAHVDVSNAKRMRVHACTRPVLTLVRTRQHREERSQHALLAM